MILVSFFSEDKVRKIERSALFGTPAIRWGQRAREQGLGVPKRQLKSSNCALARAEPRPIRHSGKTAMRMGISVVPPVSLPQTGIETS